MTFKAEPEDVFPLGVFLNSPVRNLRDLLFYRREITRKLCFNFFLKEGSIFFQFLLFFELFLPFRFGFSSTFFGRLLDWDLFFQIPLNRQITQWEMNGLEVNAGTLVGCFKAIMAFITPLYNLLVEVSRSQKHWHVDETRWLMFLEKPEKVGYRWWLCFASSQVTVFVVNSSRSSKVPLKHFGKQAKGIINVDRYSAYHVLGLIQRQLCWYHVRRDFVRA